MSKFYSVSREIDIEAIKYRISIAFREAYTETACLLKNVVKFRVFRPQVAQLTVTHYIEQFILSCKKLPRLSQISDSLLHLSGK